MSRRRSVRSYPAIEALGRRGWSGEVLARATQSRDRMMLAPVAIYEDGKPLSLALDTLRAGKQADRHHGGFWLRLGSALHGRQIRFSPAPAQGTAQNCPPFGNA